MAAGEPPVAFEEHGASEESAGYPYLIFRPEAACTECVLLLVLHGVGGRSNQPPEQSGNIADRLVHALSYRYTVTGLLGNLDGRPEDTHLDGEYRKVGRFLRRHFVVVAPQTEAYVGSPDGSSSGCVQSRWGEPARLHKFLEHVIAEDLKDLTIGGQAVLGLSMGGAGAWNAALLGRFAAAVSICGEGYQDVVYWTESGEVRKGTVNDQARNFPILHTALWAFHARNDASDSPRDATEPVLLAAQARLKAHEERSGQKYPTDHLSYNWAPGKKGSWTYFDGVWDHTHKLLSVQQVGDDTRRISEPGAGSDIISSVELTSSGPPHEMWGHFLWTAVTRDISVFQWLYQKAIARSSTGNYCLSTSVVADTFCGLLPRNFPVAVEGELLYNKSDGDCLAIDPGDGCTLHCGARGFVVDGCPGVTTLYTVRFITHPDCSELLLRNVPGSNLVAASLVSPDNAV